MTFPAVTICNNNAVMINKLLANDELNRMVYGTSDTSSSDSSTANSVSVDGIYCFWVYEPFWREAPERLVYPKIVYTIHRDRVSGAAVRAAGVTRTVDHSIQFIVR